MARGPFAPFLRSLDAVRRSGDSDAELLTRFIAGRDEAAFAELVRRHASLVWGVCRQVLGHDQDAEDAFQATFLLLARRARSVRNGAALASWLHGTAWHVSAKARRAAAARTARERRVGLRPAGDVAADVALRELQAIFHEEVARLPAKCREPFVLCVLEGRGRAEVARELCWNEGTLSTRLADARKRLWARLARRGVDVAAALCAVEMTRQAAPAALVVATVSTAVNGTISSTVAALVTGGIGSMFTAKTQLLTALALLAVVLMSGTAGLRRLGRIEAPQPQGKAQTAAASAVASPKFAILPVNITGTAIGPDNQPVKAATVYLMAEHGSASRIVKMATTDDRGHYEFRQTPVPSLSTAAGVEPTSVTVQICATAPGLAFAWRPRMQLCSQTLLERAPQGILITNGSSMTILRLASSRQTVNLVFGVPEAFAGRIVDERGTPVVGVKVCMVIGDWLRRPTTEESSFWTLMGGLPESITTSTTDPDGRFRLGNVPHNFIARLQLTHPDYAGLDLYAATTDSPVTSEVTHFPSVPTPGRQNVVFTRGIDLTFARPRSIPIRVVSSMTGEAVVGARVTASNSGPLRYSSYGETDQSGRVELRLPPGDFALDVRKRDSDFVCYRQDFTVTTDAEQPREVRLVSCGILKVETVDADTGRPLAGVDILNVQIVDADTGRPLAGVEISRLPGRGIGLGIRDSTGFSVDTRTNKKGAVRIPVAPGRLHVMPSLNGYMMIKGPTKPVELEAGKELNLRFELREQP